MKWIFRDTHPKHVMSKFVFMNIYHMIHVRARQDNAEQLSKVEDRNGLIRKLGTIARWNV